MSNKIQDILRKISYIEADLEIHKQILFSIPSKNKNEIEDVMKLIAEKRDMINELRGQIKSIDPVEFDKILKFENATAEFRKIAAEKKFSEVFTLNGSDPCTIAFKNGKIVECIVKAQDSTGDWTVLTLDADILYISKDDAMA